MKKWFLIAAVLVAGVIAVLFLTRRREPVVDGRSLSEWLRWGLDSEGPSRRSETTNAVRKMSLAAVPALVEKLSEKDSALKRKINNSDYWERFPRHWLNAATDQNAEALWGFAILGTQAVVALPQVSHLLYQPNANTYYIGWSLAHLGPEALPILRSAVTNSDVRIRTGGLRGLSARGDFALAARAEILALRNEKDFTLGRDALSHLINCRDCDVVPVAEYYLQDARPSVVRQTLESISAGIRNQSVLVPLVMPFLTNADASTRRTATNALKRLDPARAAAVWDASH